MLKNIYQNHPVLVLQINIKVNIQIFLILLTINFINNYHPKIFYSPPNYSL